MLTGKCLLVFRIFVVVSSLDLRSPERFLAFDVEGSVVFLNFINH
jgi:hypothetical protein